MQLSLEQFELADKVGFDWVTVAEHHYAPDVADAESHGDGRRVDPARQTGETLHC